MAKPVQLKDTINIFLKNIKANNKVGLDDLEIIFKKTLDKHVLKHIKFISLKNDVLKIKADSSVWLYELNLRKPDLLNTLKDEGPELAAIKDIKFFIGELK